jgi:hypothetical protein
MERAEMKRLLARSKAEPVNCAVGTAEDGKVAVLLLDKLKQPRALQLALEKQFPKATNWRFGTAEVDEEIDPKLARFHLNRPASGLARRLVKTLHGTGYNKVEIVLEDGTVGEKAGAEEEEAAAQAQEQQAAGQASPAARPAPPAHDAAQLGHALKVLAERIASVTDHDRRAELIQLAAHGQAALKAGNLAGAEAAIVGLNKAETKLAHAAPGKPLRPVWQDAKEAVDGKLGQLARELRSLEDEDANQVAEFGLFGITGGRETVGLMAALVEYDGAGPDQRAAAASGLRKAVASYRQVLDSHPMIGLIDHNPFDVEVGLQATLGGALQQIESALA